MTQEKFTPMEWELGKNGNIYSKKFPGMLIATSHKTHYNNLIASAPDMYEALKEVLLDLRGIRSQVADPLAEEIADSMRTIEAALSQANGTTK